MNVGIIIRRSLIKPRFYHSLIGAEFHAQHCRIKLGAVAGSGELFSSDIILKRNRGRWQSNSNRPTTRSRIVRNRFCFFDPELVC